MACSSKSAAPASLSTAASGCAIPWSALPVMNIDSDSVVTLSYKLFSAKGELIEESPQPITYLHGGHHGIFPKVEEALAAKAVGDSCSVTLEPEDAFGEYDAELVRVEPQDRFPTDVKIGMMYE